MSKAKTKIYAFCPPYISGIEQWQIDKYHIDVVDDLESYNARKSAFFQSKIGKRFLSYKKRLFKKLCGLEIWIIDGSALRNGLKAGDVDFTMGGNGGRYLYIPENEIWIDDAYENSEDFWPTVWHEYLERNLMLSGMPYDDIGDYHAHDIAHKLEIVLREGKYFVLPVGTFRQSSRDNCGPAALKIVLDYYNYNNKLTEKKLASLLHTSNKGTDPVAFIKVAKKLGFNADNFEAMSVYQVKKLVKQGLPVIANHTTPDPIGGHYAVIMGFSEGEFVISDPAETSGYIVKKIDKFMRDWYEKEDKTVRQGIIISPK